MGKENDTYLEFHVLRKARRDAVFGRVLRLDLDAELTRPEERDLFDLPPLPPAPSLLPPD